MNGPDHVRKQIYDLTPADLQAYPIWSSVLGEESLPGQDEATVRPRPDISIAGPHGETLFVRCRFVAANGSTYDGYFTPSHERDLGYQQPTIVTDHAQVAFWCGIREPSREALEAAAAALDAPLGAVFPMTYEPLVRMEGAAPGISIEGFMVLDLGTSEVRAVGNR